MTAGTRASTKIDNRVSGVGKRGATVWSLAPFRLPVLPSVFDATSGWALEIYALLNANREVRSESLPLRNKRRIDLKPLPRKIAITSVYGEPCDPATWSGAPNNIATAFERLGVEIEGIFPYLSKVEKLGMAASHVLSGYGIARNSESLFRGLPARGLRAARVAAAARRSGATKILHTGTLDLPLHESDDADHFLYCDQTWDLSLRYRVDRLSLTSRACAEFDEAERRCYAQMRHIFTFGDYVRDNLIGHYGVEPDRVTSVGSGMGQIEPYLGPKDYDTGFLLFVAKHLFEAKGGYLVLDAFRQARLRRPDLKLVVVWDGRDESLPRRYPEVQFLSRLRWGVLTSLYRRAALLVQPMLNDPWGQVYLEALASRTPVLGLNRNGLPEITHRGAQGFLVDEPDVDALAQAILEAMSDPSRLALMGLIGQRYVQRHYSWDKAAKKMVAAMTEIQTSSRQTPNQISNKESDR